jgi:hypothetical protein
MLCPTKTRFVGVCFLATLFASFGAARANTIPEIAAKAKQAVVEILTYDQQNRLLKTGTGFFISPDGHCLRTIMSFLGVAQLWLRPQLTQHTF